jgi:hypothetical protein
MGTRTRDEKSEPASPAHAIGLVPSGQADGQARWPRTENSGPGAGQDAIRPLKASGRPAARDQIPRQTRRSPTRPASKWFGPASLIFQGGWSWSECVKPIVRTERCQVIHVGYAVSQAHHGSDEQWFSNRHRTGSRDDQRLCKRSRALDRSRSPGLDPVLGC